jgi:hypothetical protein
MKEQFETKGAEFQDSSGTIRLENVEGNVSIQGENPYDWHKHPAFWEQIEGNLGGLRKIYTVGGEPLLIDRHYDLLRLLIDKGRSQNVIIEYNSNITVIPSRAMELWKSFKEVRIGASIDGYGKINDYIRHPSRWETIEKNLSLLDAADAPLKLWIATTAQAYNIYYLTDLLKWKILKNFGRVNTSPHAPFLKLHPLHKPAHFSVQALPEEVKRATEARFADFQKSWFLPHLHESGLPKEEKAGLARQMSQLLGGYLTLMRKKDLSDLLPTFWRETTIMDAYRKESFQEVMPEIAGPIVSHLRRNGMNVG